MTASLNTMKYKVDNLDFCPFSVTYLLKISHPIHVLLRCTARRNLELLKSPS